jgi:hypothetical protein
MVGLYGWNIFNYFWAYTMPNDPLQYLGPAYWGTTFGCWPWLDRINLAINLRIFMLIFSNPYIAGMLYVGFINILILIFGSIWAFKKQGFWAALIFGVLFNTSFLTLGWSTFLYPDQTVALYALLAFITFFSEAKEKSLLKYLTGFFIGLALFSKITGVAVLLFFFIYCVYKKKWIEIKQICIGLICATLFVGLAFILLYNYQSFIYTFKTFFTSNIQQNLSLPHKIAANYGGLLTSTIYFPFIALFICLGAYKVGETKYPFFISWAFIILIFLLHLFGHPIPSYIYTAFIFTILGLSMYLATIIESDKSLFLKAPAPNVGIVIIMLFLLIFGLKLGFHYPAVKDFSYYHAYLDKLDIYVNWTPFGLNYPKYIPVLFSLIPLLLVGLLSMTELLRTKLTVIFLVLFIAFGGSFYNGGLAYKKASFERNYTKESYAFALSLKQVPSNNYSIYINPKKYSPERIELMIWILSYLYSKPDQIKYDSLTSNYQATLNKIKNNKKGKMN